MVDMLEEYQDSISPRISKYLEIFEYNELRNYCLDLVNERQVSKKSWEVLTKLINHLKNNKVQNEDLVYFRDIFSYIAEMGNSKEMLLAFLEHFDPMIELDIVQLLVPAIIIVSQNLIKKDKKNQCYNIAMVVSALLYYLDGLNLPNYTDFNPLKNTPELLEEIKIARFIQDCVDFGEAVLNNVKKQLKKKIITETHFQAVKQELMMLCCGLLETFTLIDAEDREISEHEPVYTGCVKISDGESRENDKDSLGEKLSINTSKNLILLTTKLNTSWTLLCDVTWRNFVSFERKPNAEDFNKINQARSSFLQICLVKNIGNMPQIIDPVFAFIRCIPSILNLIKSKNLITIHKGLELCRQVSNKLEPFALKTVVINQELKLTKQHNITNLLLQAASNITINCQVKLLRQRALQFLTRFLDKFVWLDRYNLLNYLFNNVDHFGLVGYLITYFKNKLAEVLKDKVLDDSNIFLKKERFFKLIEICLYLPHKSETDILTEYDKIMAALNLLLFLFIRDKENMTQIWSKVKNIELEYLNPLQTGINLSRMHYREELKTQSKPKLAKQADETNFSINGISLPSMPIEERKRVLETAISNFDMMQSVCSRVQHYIDLHQANP